MVTRIANTFNAVKEKYEAASEEERAKMRNSIAEIDQGCAVVFVNAEEQADFEDELTDITEEETVRQLVNLFEQLAA